MKTLQSIFLILFVLAFSTFTFSQKVDIALPSPKKAHRFSLTLSQGLSISRTGDDILQGMINSGMNDRTPIVHHQEYIFFFFFDYTTGGVSYPRMKESKSYIDFQARYDLTPKSALAVNWNTSKKTTVEGFDRQGSTGNFLTLDSRTRVLTLEYILRTGKGWSGLSIGPALAFHSVDQRPISIDKNLFHHKGVRPGMHLGYTLSFLKNSNWIVAANVGYNWFLKDNVGPVTVEGEFPSVYTAPRVSLNNLDFGITGGLKF